MLLRFPTLALWDQYQKEVAEVWQTLAVNYADFDVPADLVELAREGHFQAWTAIMSGAFRLKTIQQKLIHIARTYLNPRIEGSTEDPEEQWAFIEENLPVCDIVLIFAAMLAIDDWLEKKSRFLLMTAFQMRESVQGLAGSVGKPEPVKLRSGHGRRSASVFGSDS